MKKEYNEAMQNEKYVLEVKMLVGVDAPDINDARELIQDLFGDGELDGFGVTCYSVTINPVA